MQSPPMNNQCPKCKEWYHTAHVCAADIERAMANMGREKKGVDRIYYCAFCGKNNNEVAVMISGVDCCICDECVRCAQRAVDDYWGNNFFDEFGESFADHLCRPIFNYPSTQ